MPTEFDPISLLKVLSNHKVKFVVIGGFAAWIHGAPIVTMDVDIVYASDQNNTESIVDALLQIDAHYRHQGDRKLAPTTSGLSSTQAAGHHLLETRLGNLDLLRTVAGLGYEDLCGEAISIEIDGTTSSFSPLSRIIALKEAAGRPKDIAALPTLRAALLDSGDS